MKRMDYNVLKLYKFYPKIENFTYLRYQFYIYVYLDPFTELKKPKGIKVHTSKKDYEFMYIYEPFYVGKASTGMGYRHHQHIQKYQIGQEGNKLKVEKFKELERNFERARKENLYHLPQNWDEYKQNWIAIVQDFSNSKDLLEFEVSLIKKIGTKYKHQGPLVNKIENAFIL